MRDMAPHPEKVCTVCGKSYPATEKYFRVDRRRPTGIGALCRSCVSEQGRQRYKAHYAHMKEVSRAWVQAHPEKVREKARRFYVKHAEQLKVRRALSGPQYLSQRRAAGARYRQRHPEQHSVRVSAWKKAHPERQRAIQNARMARQRGAAVVDFTAAQWRALQAAFHHRCAYCGSFQKGKLTRDHIEPVINGGHHTLHNIVPACRSCNAKKGKGPPLIPVQPLLFAVESLP